MLNFNLTVKICFKENWLSVVLFVRLFCKYQLISLACKFCDMCLVSSEIGAGVKQTAWDFFDETHFLPVSFFVKKVIHVVTVQ